MMREGRRRRRDGTVWTPAPQQPPTRQGPPPRAVTVYVDAGVYAAAVAGAADLVLPAGTLVDAGDVVHLVKSSTACCFRLVRSAEPAPDEHPVPVTVVAGIGWCAGGHR